MTEQIEEQQLRVKSTNRKVALATLAIVSAIPSAIIVGIIAKMTSQFAGSVGGIAPVLTLALHGVVGIGSVARIPRDEIFRNDPEQMHGCAYVAIILIGVVYVLIGGLLAILILN